MKLKNLIEFLSFKQSLNMYEHFFQCPYCWEEISVLLDPSIREQTYIEDCEVCCRPIEFHIRFEDQELIEFRANDIDQ